MNLGVSQSGGHTVLTCIFIKGLLLNLDFPDFGILSLDFASHLCL